MQFACLQMIYLKCQGLFSLKNNKCYLLQFWLVLSGSAIITRQSEGQLYPPPQNDNGAATKFKAQIGGLQL